MKLLLSVLLVSLMLVGTGNCGTVELPRTGQTSCWDVTGTSSACTGTGQDGDKLAGVAWNASNRFTNNGNGTVTDTLTGLVWLINANCTETSGGIVKTSGTLTWANALNWSNSLTSGKCGLSDGSSAGQWRLPNRKELLSLIDRQSFSPAISSGHPFSGVQSQYYWTSSTFTYTNTNNYAWEVNMYNGDVDSSTKGSGRYIWPVRGGQ